MPDTYETRIAVTEAIVESHGRAIENNQLLTAKLVDKLDLHITESQSRDQKISDNLVDVTVAVTELTAVVSEATVVIRDIKPMVKQHNETLVQWETARKTLIAIVVAISTLVGGSWAVYTYVNPTTKETQGK